MILQNITTKESSAYDLRSAFVVGPVRAYATEKRPQADVRDVNQSPAEKQIINAKFHFKVRVVFC